MALQSVRVILAAAVLALPLAGSGCSSSSDNSTTGPSPLIAMTSSASGDGQTAQVGTALPNALRVVVTLSGAPQVGTSVTWAAQGAGASVSPTSAVTDANGVATTTWTLGTASGAQTATATLAGASGSPVTFTATASAVPVPVIAMTASASGNAQTGGVTTALANPLRVIVTLSGAAQAGDTVQWAVAGTGASVNPVKSVTDATGVATTTWTLGQAAGQQSATATLAGATGSPVAFSATATAGAASQITLQSGNNQSALTSSLFAAPLVVKVADQFGNGVAGDTVTWASVLGLTTVGSAKSASDATGLAEMGLTAGGTTGKDTITATATGLSGSPVRFTANVVAASLTDSVVVGPGISFTSARNGTSNPAVDTIAVGGTMTWTWAGGDHGILSTGSPSFTSQAAAQTSGTYQVTFNSPGTYTYDCIIHGSAMTGTIVVR